VFYAKEHKKNMGRGKMLSEVEKATIDAYKISGKSNREIAKLLERSSNAIDQYLNSKGKQVVRRKRGPRPNLSERDKRRIIAGASQTTKGCRRIRNKVTPHVSKSTVHRVLKESPH